MVDNHFISKVTDIILNNIQNELFGVNELAQQLQLSRSQLFRKVKSQTGESANFLIRKIRLTESLRLLKEQELSISEIAYQVGFCNPSYFNKCFHKHFGITPGDFKKDPEALTEPTQHIASKKNYRIITLLSIIIILVLILLTQPFLNRKSDSEESGLPQFTSIAVLPLLDLSESHSKEYLVLGLTDAITLELSKLKGLRVISRGSSMLFQDSIKLYADIAKKLNVELLLEGSVIYGKDGLRVTVQLIEPFPHEKHIWGNKYDFQSSDIIQLAESISTQIAEEIHVAIHPQQHVKRQSKINSEAYDYYCRGKYLWQKQNPKSVKKAIEYLSKSISIDSTFAPAYITLAECYIIMNKLIPNQEDKLSNRAESHIAITHAIAKALSLDESLAEAYITKGNILGKYDWDWEGMKSMAEKGLLLNPNNPYGHILLTKYWTTKGDYKKALEEALVAERLDPLNPHISCLLAERYEFTGQYDLAIKKYKQVLELYPDYGFAWNGIGFSYYLKGEREKAKEAWAELHTIMGNHAMAEYFNGHDFNTSINYWLTQATGGSKLYCSNPSIIAMAHTLVDLDDGVIEYLDLALKFKNEDLPMLIQSPVFKPYYNHTQFTKIVAELDIIIER
ncbi:helix-turn-helix domain-containing protein [Carboxylicivirga marina]|uniref:Helix-turn-helix domain-containing protein n=1 Tax=Carboxylicivirga marina TaxID=2800988 RepID=A0ABS1HH17_9BACT|nr:helix-turn-helix domain-containing protein [Carboxylicivirga marina]MBK3516583.1 helix-turn-helix domain-containing protein [Carboxylicivirga marina]